MTTHLMIDIETLGTRPGAIVLSAALVRFSDEASCTVNFSTTDQALLGLQEDASTRAWWGTQGAEAWRLATENPAGLGVALDYLRQWIAWAAPNGDALIWCHGASFDAPILEELYRRLAQEAPWKFWQVRDTRTLYDLASVDLQGFAVPPPHVALNDALAQTRAANVALKVLARAHQVAAA